MRKQYFLVAFLVCLLPALGRAQQDPFLGTWKMNPAKSSSDPTPLSRSLVVKRESAGPNSIKVTTDSISSQGVTEHTEYTTTIDGKENPLKGSPDMDTVSLRQLDPRTRIQINKKSAQVVRMLRQTISPDGKTSTSVSISVNAKGVASHGVTVFDRQ